MLPFTARLGRLLIASLQPCDAGSSAVGWEARGSAPLYIGSGPALAARPARSHSHSCSRCRPVPVPAPSAGPRVRPSPAQQRPLQHGPVRPCRKLSRDPPPGASSGKFCASAPAAAARGCPCAGCALAAGPPIRACGARRCKNAMYLELLSRGGAKD